MRAEEGKGAEQCRKKEKNWGKNVEARQTEINVMDFAQRGNGGKKAREKKREKESIREGSWTVIAIHSRMAKTEKVERQGDVKTRDEDNRRSFGELQQKKR